MAIAEKGILLHLSDLLQELTTQHDFVFGTDAHLRVGKFLSGTTDSDLSLDEWKFRLAALLCRSAEQQRVFYIAFDNFINKKQAQKIDIQRLVQEREAAEVIEEKPKDPLSIETPIAQTKPDRKPNPATTKGKSGPIRIELGFPTNPLRVWNTSAMSQAVRPLLEKEWSSTTDWDIPLSIRATIRNGGNPTFHRRRRKTAPQYILLIDQRSARDHLAGLYADLGAEWRRRDIDVEWFFYDFTPYRCWHDRREPASYTHIERLAAEYQNAKLIIVGEAAGLLDLPDLRPSNLTFNLMEIFRAVALLVPQSTAEWGNAELSLCQLFPVVPASPTGIATLTAQWNAPSVWTPAYWRLAVPEPSTPLLEKTLTTENAAEAIENLQYYLGKTGFPWLCAAAVYPEIYYQLTALLNDEGIARRADLTEWEQNQVWQNALLRLSRVRWFREGEIPAAARMLLRERLSTDKMVLVRQQLLAVFAATDTPPPDSYAANSLEKLTLIFEKANSENADEDWKQLTTEGNLSFADIAEAVGDSFATELDRRINSPVQPIASQSNTGDFNYQQQQQQAYSAPPEMAQTQSAIFPERGENKIFQILWVDDRPKNNAGFIRMMQQEQNIFFKTVLDTEGGIKAIYEQYFDLVISDLGRPKDAVAGLNLLREYKKIGYLKPFAIFSTQIEETYRQSLTAEGAAFVGNEKLALKNWILGQIAERTQAQYQQPNELQETNPVVQQVKTEIANGNTAEAIKLLRDWADANKDTHADLINQLTLLQGQYSDLQHQYLKLGIVSPNDYKLKLNRINVAVLQLLDKLPPIDKAEKKPLSDKGFIKIDFPKQMSVHLALSVYFSIAPNQEILMQDAPKSEDAEIKEIRISETMSIEILDTSTSKMPNFEIQSQQTSAFIQKIASEQPTEWQFTLTPMRLGKQNLVIKIKVIETIDGKERSRDMVIEQAVEVIDPSQAEQTAAPNLITLDKERRIKNVLTIFETGSSTPNYAQINIYADGKEGKRQITYGNGQTTEEGNLKHLIEAYIERKGRFAEAFQPYIPKFWVEPLADNEAFINLLRQAGTEDPIMAETQEAFFDQRYYQPAFAYFTENGFSYPLSMLVIFDSYMHSGKIQDFLRNRFEEKPPAQGGNEKAWINAYVRARQEWLGTHKNTILNQTIYRTQTFLNLIAADEWLLDKPIMANGVLSI